MLRRNCFALAIVTAFGLTGMPDAQADPTSEAGNWNGVYFGIGAGAGSLDYDLLGHASKSKLSEKRNCTEQDKDDYDSEVCLDPHSWRIRRPGKSDYNYDYSKDIRVSDDEWNIFGTVQVGVDYQISNGVVIGAFADYDLYTGSGSFFSTPWIRPHDKHSHYMGSLSGNVELDSVWSVGGRIGVLVTPRFLLYGLGGYTQASLDVNMALSLSGDWGRQPYSVNLPDELHGYFIGAGGEIKLRDNLSFKLEYRYSDFDQVSASISKSFVDQEVHCGCYEHRTTRGREADAELDAELHAVRAVLVYRFGDSDEALQPMK